MQPWKQVEISLGSIADASPKVWKNRILNCIGNLINFCIFDHHLIKKTNYTAWTSWEVENYIKYEYWKVQKTFDRKSVYPLPCMVAADTKLRVFQYKMLSNILFANKMLFKFKKVKSLVSYFCKAEDET